LHSRLAPLAARPFWGNDSFNAIALGVNHHQDYRPDSAKDSKAILVIVPFDFEFLSKRIIEDATGILKTYPLVLALVLEILFWVPVAS
jgi:hypothetical protein